MTDETLKFLHHQSEYLHYDIIYRGSQMTPDTIYSESSKQTIGNAAQIAAIYADKQKKEAELAAKKQKIWENLNLYINKGWHFHILHILTKEKTFFDQVKSEDAGIRQTLESVQITAQQSTEEVKKRFPLLIENSFRNSKVSLDKDSRHPRYSFQNGFFKLEIDEFKGTSRLSDTEGSLGEIPSDIDAIVESINKEYHRVFERPFDGKKFFKNLRKNYLAVTKTEKVPDGEGVPIRKITTRFSKNEKGFRTDEFVVDLTRLVEEGLSEGEGLRLELQQTRDTNKGMLLYGSMNRGYIGFITFRKMV